MYYSCCRYNITHCGKKSIIMMCWLCVHYNFRNRSTAATGPPQIKRALKIDLVSVLACRLLHSFIAHLNRPFYQRAIERIMIIVCVWRGERPKEYFNINPWRGLSISHASLGFLLSVGPALGHRKKPAQGHRPGRTREVSTHRDSLTTDYILYVRGEDKYVFISYGSVSVESH